LPNSRAVIDSENLYPVELQEFGYIVEDASAAAQLRRDYWDQAWKWSQAAAISGEEAPSCVFQRAGGATRRCQRLKIQRISDRTRLTISDVTIGI
jgi:hypothetical protein